MRTKVRPLLKSVFRVHVFNKLYWRYRDAVQTKWAKAYIGEKFLNHPFRRIVLEAVARHDPVTALLETGCASDPNLFLLSRLYPNARLFGLVISPRAVQVGREFLARE